jgi:hypothetical protein
MDDGAVFGGAVGEFDVASDVGAAQTGTHDIGFGDTPNAGGSDGDTEACSDQGENGQPLRGFLDDMRAEAVFFAEGDGLLVREASGYGGEEDEGLVAELSCGDNFARGERMSVGKDGDEGFGEERLDVESVGGAAVAEEAGVEDALVERLDDAGGVGLGELKLDFGIEAAVVAKHGWQRSEHGGADEADAEEAEVAVADTAGLVKILLDVAQSAAGTLEEDFASGCELHCAGCSVKEGVAEDLFELADLLREWWLCEMKAICCAAEVEFFSNCDEIAQMSQLDVTVIHI